MILKKQTKNEVLANALEQVNSKITFMACNIKHDSSKIIIETHFTYDDNGFEKMINCNNIEFYKTDLDVKEIELSSFDGVTYNSKTIDMCDKLMNDYLDANNCFGLESGDWENI